MIRDRDKPMSKKEQRLWEQAPYDEKAFRRIFFDYFKVVFYTTMNAIKSPDIAEQISVETFMIFSLKCEPPLDGYKMRSLFWSRKHTLVFKEIIEAKKEWQAKEDKEGIVPLEWMATRQCKPKISHPLEENTITASMKDELRSLLFEDEKNEIELNTNEF